MTDSISEAQFFIPIWSIWNWVNLFIKTKAIISQGQSCNSAIVIVRIIADHWILIIILVLISELFIRQSVPDSRVNCRLYSVHTETKQAEHTRLSLYYFCNLSDVLCVATLQFNCAGIFDYRLSNTFRMRTSILNLWCANSGLAFYYFFTLLLQQISIVLSFIKWCNFISLHQCICFIYTHVTCVSLNIVVHQIMDARSRIIFRQLQIRVQ